MNRSVVKNLAWDVGAATSVALLPLAIYLKHNDYPMGNPEAILILAAVLLAGLFWGVLMNLGRMRGRLVVLVFLAILTVDIQTKWITTWGLRLLLNTIFFSVLFWYLRRRLSQITVLLAGAMLLGTLVMPARDQIRFAGSSLAEPVERPDLPFILHLVLDEHIGIEGLPRRFDPDRAIAGEIRDSYLDKGFLVFGRAYSNYYRTHLSLSNMMNFTFSRDPAEYFPYPPGYHTVVMENAWFKLLKEKGYRIHIIQTEYIAYEKNLELDGDLRVNSSVTIPGNSIYPLAQVDMPVAEKARFIMGNYMRLSFFLSMMRDGYRSVRLSSLGQSLRLPPWDPSGQRLSPLTAMKGVDLLARDLEFAGPGKAFFAHVLIPHFPYTYDRDCGVLEMKDSWLNASDPDLAPVKNDPESRAQRYLAYQEQLLCTNRKIDKILHDLSGRPWWDDAMVVIHGDHGSRIELVAPSVPVMDECTDQGLMDSFSTLFAIKRPGLPAGYDRRQLPLGQLFKRLVRDGGDPGDPDWESRPRALIADDDKPMQEIVLPFFDHGIPQKDTINGQ